MKDFGRFLSGLDTNDYENMTQVITCRDASLWALCEWYVKNNRRIVWGTCV